MDLFVLFEGLGIRVSWRAKRGCLESPGDGNLGTNCVCFKFSPVFLMGDSKDLRKSLKKLS